MADIVRYGVLSTSQIALNRHLPAAQAAANSQVVAIASRDQAKADKSAGEHGIAKAYGSYQALLHDPDIDAVSITTMWDQHTASISGFFNSSL